MRVTRLVLLAAALLLAVLLPSEQALAFSDTGTSPYQEAIDDLADRGIISGYENGTFRPGNPVLRAQFAKMITGTIDLEVTEADPLGPFTDLGPDPSNSLYPHEYVAAAYFNGITKGVTPTNFQPYKDIPRAQVFTMVVRAVDEFFPGLLEDPPADYEGPWGYFDATHEDYARKAFWNDLDWNLDHSGFTPWGKMPRGEVAQALSNLLVLTDQVPPGLREARLVRVVDGDTIEVSLDGKTETVRLIGIDAPEMGEPRGEGVKANLEYWLEAPEVIFLELDMQERDEYGRVLAYVWVEDVMNEEENVYFMVNEELLWRGMAVVYPVPPNLAYAESFEFYERVAQTENKGIWEQLSPSPLEVTGVQFYAYDPMDEWVDFRVLATGNLIGYVVENDYGQRYEFPDRIFQEGEMFWLHTGAGVDSQTDLYWGSGRPIWNEAGDALYLLDPDGRARLLELYY